MSERATYVYCVVRMTNAPSSARLSRAPEGLDDAEAPRLVDIGGGYHAVVATVPLARYAAEVIEAKLRDLDWALAVGAAHEAVVEHASKLGTVVPMKLFTIFSTDERATSHLAKSKRELDRVVTRIAGCEEWGLRVLFDEAKARARAEATATKRVASGADFLRRKKEQHDARRVRASEARGEVEGLYERLERTAKRAVRRTTAPREVAGSVLLDAVFLVPQDGAKVFKATVASTAKQLAREGFHVTLTGPWPAYSFIEAR